MSIEADQVLILLKEGKARIKQGWCQGKIFDSNGNFCMVGAVTSSRNSGETFMACLNIMDHVIFPSTSLGEWNDHPGRTKKEVLAVFDQAIALRLKELENA
jgi:hypothetical protein